MSIIKEIIDICEPIYTYIGYTKTLQCLQNCNLKKSLYKLILGCINNEIKIIFNCNKYIILKKN